ncbi:dethiobiotin synthase [Anaerophilus nitritogenes]|uniref:dethiobiotin synthase n=1 Tax=Anaerophilus nitritogenes TaxID=2498136 RepID=UPI00101BF51F|nr:dethiobiotin synthase [Anaerophilus nitritogenes]
MNKGLFITATGTDVGKTFVTALIVKKLRDHGIHAGYYKAALSGAQKTGKSLVPGDAKYVCDISGIKDDPQNLVSFIYETAVSPHLAAKIENHPVDKSIILRDFDRLKFKYEYICVEGSGGIICPLRIDTQTIMLTDIIKMLQLDIIIIASSCLGTINETVLTVEYAKKLGINIKGIILNSFNKENFLHVDNKKQIESLTGVSVIGCVAQHACDLDMDLTILTDIFKEV